MKNKILELPWVKFNRAIMKIEDHEEVHRLLIHEREGQGRTIFLLRLHQRYNRLRAVHERHRLINEEQTV